MANGMPCRFFYHENLVQIPPHHRTLGIRFVTVGPYIVLRRLLRRLAKPEEFQMGQVKIDEEMRLVTSFLWLQNSTDELYYR